MRVRERCPLEYQRRQTSGFQTAQDAPQFARREMVDQRIDAIGVIGATCEQTINPVPPRESRDASPRGPRRHVRAATEHGAQFGERVHYRNDRKNI
jgi:hypothetical protein